MIKKMVLWSSIEDSSLSEFFEKLVKVDWSEVEQLDLYIIVMVANCLVV